MTVTWELSAWQADVFQSDARFRVVRAGRRAGKNILAVADQIEYARAPERSPWGADEGATCWWVGPTYTQAEKYGFQKALDNIPAHWIDGEPKRSEPYEVPLINGVTLEYRTYDKPDSLQGAGVDHMVIDEAPYMPGSIWENDLRPMLLDNQGTALMIGKPLTRNWFYRLDQRGESPDYPEYESFHATSYDNPTIPDSEIESERGSTSERAFKREYLAEYIDDSGGVFEQVRDRIVRDYDPATTDGIRPYATGVDFARHEDYTVIHTLDSDGTTVEHRRLRGEPWPRIQSAIEAVVTEYPGTVALDATRDNKIITDLEDSLSESDVRPVTFTSKRKRELIENLVTHVEQESVAIPDLPVVVSELQLFEYDVTRAGNVRYNAPEGEHDDCVDAFALAVDTWASPGAKRRVTAGGASRQSRR